MPFPTEIAGFNVIRERWRGWSGWPRLGWTAANGLLIIHLLGSFLPACSVPPSPTIVQDAYQAISFYPQALYLDHGYHFFGPDPGATTTLRFVATRADGQRVRGSYPDKRISPRLRYHRHFMLTESLPRLQQSGSELGPLQLSAYAAAILQLHDAEAVDLYQVTRNLPAVEAVLAGRRLDDAVWIEEQHLGHFDRQRQE